MEPPDCQWGKQEANGSWTGNPNSIYFIIQAVYIGVVAAVEKGLADFSFNLLLTGQREEAIDFTVPYQGNKKLIFSSMSKLILSYYLKMTPSPFVCPNPYQPPSGRASSDLFQA